MRKRFSVRATLLIVTIAAVALGYSQWRRQRILHQIDALSAAGVTVYGRQAWWTRAWMPTPRAAQLLVSEGPPGRFEFNGVGYSLAEIDDRIVTFRKQLSELGVHNFVVEATLADGGRQQIVYGLDRGEKANSRYSLKAALAARPDVRWIKSQ